METITLAYGYNLFGQSEVTLLHDAFPEAIAIAHEDPAALVREVEQILVGITKAILAKFLNVVRKTKGSYLSEVDKQRLEDLQSLKVYFTRRMRLATVQRALVPQLDNLARLLPRPQSRSYPSQQAKYCFFQAIAAFDLEQAKRLISGSEKTGYNV